MQPSAMQRLLDLVKKESVALFSILYFLTVAILVWQNNMADVNKGTINAIIRNDIEKNNGTTTLFDNLTKLANGETIKARSSLFSFKQVQYSFKDRAAFQDAGRRAAASEAGYYNEDYYFQVGNRTVVINSQNPDNMTISEIPKENYFPVILRPNAGIHFNNPRSFEHPFALKKSGTKWRTIGYDIDGKNKYIALEDTVLSSFLFNHGSYSWHWIRNCLITFAKDSVFVTPFGLEADSDNIRPAQILDTKDQFEHIISIEDEVSGIGIIGEKANVKRLRSYYTPVLMNNFGFFSGLSPRKDTDLFKLPIQGTTSLITKDSSGNLRYLSDESRSPQPFLEGNLRQLGLKDDITLAESMRFFNKSEQSIYFLVPLLQPEERNFILDRYSIVKGNVSKSDSITLNRFSDKEFQNLPVILSDMVWVYEYRGETRTGFDLDGHPLSLHDRDSILSNLFRKGLLSSPAINKDGLFLFSLNNDAGDFALFHRTGKNRVTATFTSGQSWNLNNTAFDSTVVYDYYYLVIFCCIIIVVYYLILIGLHHMQNAQPFSVIRPPAAAVPSENYKLQLTYYTMESLRKRSDIMLRLGITFGIFGVLVSAFVFQASNLSLGQDWKDPHTLLGVLKPMIILIFMETFTFYFLKQYRIIFNEYKLYYSILIDLLSTNSVLELEKVRDLDPGLLKLLRDKLCNVRYDMYEKDTKEKIQEFNEVDLKSAADLLGKLKSAGKP